MVKPFKFNNSDFQVVHKNPDFEAHDFEPVAQFNEQRQEQRATANDPRGWMEKLPMNAAAGGAELAQSIANAPYNITKAIEQLSPQDQSRPTNQQSILQRLGMTAEDIPHTPNYDIGKMMGLPNTPGDRLVQSIFKNLPAGKIPDMEALKGIPYLGGIASRVVPQMAWGAATSDKPLQGAGEFGAGQLAMEALGLPFKGAGWLAEKFNPIGKTKESIDAIRGYFGSQKAAQKEAYDAALKPYGNEKIQINPKNLFDSKTRKFFTAGIDKVYDALKDNPTINNLHKMQSQLFSSANKITERDQASNMAREALLAARKRIQGHITNQLKGLDKDAHASYEKGSQITKDIISPMTSSKPLRQIMRGKETDLTPQQLVKHISTGYKNEKIPAEHYLMSQRDAIQNAINRGQLAQNIISPTVGGLIGGIAPHFAGANPILQGMGLGGGAAIAKYLTPAFIHNAQNPAMQTLMKAAKHVGEKGVVRPAIGYHMYNKDEES